MTKQESIKYISSLISAPDTVSEGDESSIASFRQRFPYFVPIRYLLALESHKKSAWSPAMLSGIQPYTGNWILFCDFLEAGNRTGNIDNDVEELHTSEEPVAIPEIKSEIFEGSEVEGKEFSTEAPEFSPADAGTKAAEEDTFIEILTEPAVGDEALSAQKIDIVENAPVEEPVFAEVPPVEEEIARKETPLADEEPLITPIHSHDYFLHQGERISEDIPEEITELKYEQVEDEEDKSLMVMMSFSEWLSHFKNSSAKQKEEAKDKKALKTMWQKEKLAAAMEEENEEIPENVFEMAVNSITQEDGLVSETLADIYIKQGKYDKAIEMYRKLSLRNPQKNVYFARKIDEVLKDKQS